MLIMIPLLDFTDLYYAIDEFLVGIRVILQEARQAHGLVKILTR